LECSQVQLAALECSQVQFGEQGRDGSKYFADCNILEQSSDGTRCCSSCNESMGSNDLTTNFVPQVWQ